jgi:hypothetical protein
VEVLSITGILHKAINRRAENEAALENHTLVRPSAFSKIGTVKCSSRLSPSNAPANETQTKEYRASSSVHGQATLSMYREIT